MNVVTNDLNDIAHNWATMAAMSFVDPMFPELHQSDPTVSVQDAIDRAIALGDIGFYYNFGQAMKRIATNRQVPKAMKEWAKAGPGGTECRMWYRAYYFYTGCGNEFNSAVAYEGCDGPRLRDMVQLFKLVDQ